jgi:aspartyl-tRNA(Asn)/glutamyl-tRNA(Gln) amidotransferase subunit A
MSGWPAIAELAEAVRSGKTTASANVEKALQLIEDKKEFEAIIAVTADRARQRAKAIDAAPKGRLAGVPFIAKDNFLVFGAETTAASNILKGFTAPYQATAIERLEAEGAICVAKANLDAFAHGASTENSDFFTTKNPHDKSRVPGGSSGGSAAAVALDMVPFSLGTDTGGSIRQPASFSGVVGYKPTYGLVSRSGVVAMGSSLDVVGPMTRSVEDAALVLDVIAGQDELDATTVERDAAGYGLSGLGLKGKKIGVIKEYFGEGLADDVENVIKSAADKLQAQGAELVEVSLPSLPLALAVYYILCPAEVSSNLGRYDGQRYGFKEAKRRIMIGTYVLSSGYYDAYYKRAQTVRTKIINEFEAAFKEVDFLLGPVAPTTAFKIGENANDPLAMYLADVMTVGANLAGVPAISLPAGVSERLPVGLQLMAAQHQDRSLLELAKAAEGVLA